MDFFGPDMGKLARQHTEATNTATNNYMNSVMPYANANGQYNLQQTGATLPTQQMDVLGRVSDYLDPSIAYQQEQAMKANAAQYGSTGSYFSGPAAAQGNRDVANIAGQGFGAAFDRAMADNNRINALGQQQFGNQMQIDNFNNNALGQNFNQFQTTFGNMNDIYGTKLGNDINAANTALQAKAGQKSGWDYIMDVGKLGAAAYQGIAG